MKSMDVNCRVIEAVKRRPLLYRSHESLTVRKREWESIARELGMEDRYVMLRWHALRNNYRAALQHGHKPPQTFKYHRQMSFVLPQLMALIKAEALVKERDSQLPANVLVPEFVLTMEEIEKDSDTEEYPFLEIESLEGASDSGEEYGSQQQAVQKQQQHTLEQQQHRSTATQQQHSLQQQQNSRQQQQNSLQKQQHSIQQDRESLQQQLPVQQQQLPLRQHQNPEQQQQLPLRQHQNPEQQHSTYTLLQNMRLIKSQPQFVDEVQQEVIVMDSSLEINENDAEAFANQIICFSDVDDKNVAIDGQIFMENDEYTIETDEGGDGGDDAGKADSNQQQLIEEFNFGGSTKEIRQQQQQNVEEQAKEDNGQTEEVEEEEVEEGTEVAAIYEQVDEEEQQDEETLKGGPRKALKEPTPPSASQANDEDQEDKMFVDLIAATLRNMAPERKRTLKRDIMNLVFA